MEQGYEKRLLGSPYKSPVKPVSPMKTPTKENYVDRYIPLRTNARWKSASSFEPSNSHIRKLFQPNQGVHTTGESDTSMHHGLERSWMSGNMVGSSSSNGRVSRDNPAFEPQACDLLSALVANELAESSCSMISGTKPDGSYGILSPRENHNVFSFKMRKDSPCKLKTSPYSMSPVSEKSQRMLQCPQKQARRISRVPYKVLDAPELQDDFYLNLVDWSSQNVLAVGLGTCVYLWNAFTSQVTRLCDVAGESDVISSVAWSKKGSHLAIGTYRGHVQIWDITKSACINSLTGHLARVGALAWNADLLASGSRDRYIFLRDTRASSTTGGGPSEPVGNVATSTTVPPESSAVSVDSDEFTEDFYSHEPMFFHQHTTETIMDTTPDVPISLPGGSSPMFTDVSRQDPTDVPSAPPAESALPSRDSDSTLPWPLATSLIRTTSVVTSTNASTNADLNGRTIHGAVRILKDHRQEVCGLKWSPDSQYLASGGNDNRLLVWSQHAPADGGPVLTYEEHVAAVKAIAWSPHQHGLLASGGGTADRCIRFWNTLTGQALRSVDTGSQVCNIAWSIHSNELVSTHGYSQNQILVWRYPSLTQLVKLTGHSYRVLYLAISPDGENIVTGAGDETLRFWNIFTRAKTPKTTPSKLHLFNGIR